MTGPIRIEKVTTLPQLERVRQLEESIWRIQSTPTILTYTTGRNGGFTLGAFEGDTLIGFCYGFPGFREGHSYFCSHMLGIHPDYRHRAIGEQLKLAQAREAQAKGYRLITWTYDPLETANARLNLVKLRAIGTAYRENHYGQMQDGLNDGLDTDRFILEWWLRSGHVRNDGAWLQSYQVDPQRCAFGVSLPQNGFPEPLLQGDGGLGQDAEKGTWVPVPLGFQAIKRSDMSLAIAWRKASRSAFQGLLKRGMVAVHLAMNKTQALGYYLFLPRNQLNLVDEEPD